MFNSGRVFKALPLIFKTMPRLFRKEIKQLSHKISNPFKDKVCQDGAYTLSNILQSAQLNRPLPPMKTYNFSSVKDLQSSDVPVVVDDICFAGNLQAQLDESVANAKNRISDYKQQLLNQQINVPQSDKDSQPSQE